MIRIQAVRLGALVVALVVLFACNVQRCSEGATCGITTGPTAVPSPTLTPSPIPTPTPSLPDPCDPDGATLNFLSDESKIISPNDSKQLDFTPVKDGEPVLKSCNTKRWPDWSVETIKVVTTSTSVCSLSSTFHNYTPTLTASNRTGDRCVVTGSLDVAGPDKVNRHTAVFEADVR